MTVAAAAARPGLDAWSWWETRRLRYNLALAVAGWLAWGGYAAAIWGLGPYARLEVDEGEITLFTVLIQGVAYLIVMGAANVCFLLGPLAETIIKPADTDRFRRRAFAMGFWGSAALPFAFPALVTLGLLQRIWGA